MTHLAALQMEGVSHRIGGTDILRQVDLTVMPGERLALIGPNGAGKTTLFNVICFPRCRCWTTCAVP